MKAYFFFFRPIVEICKHSAKIRSDETDWDILGDKTKWEIESYIVATLISQELEGREYFEEGH